MLSGGNFASKLQGAAQACVRSIRSYGLTSSSSSLDSIVVSAERDTVLDESNKSTEVPLFVTPTQASSYSHPMLMDNLHPAVLFNVAGLVVVVTGGGTGIGLMIAKALENNGAIVYIVGRREEVLRKAASENNKFGNIIPLHGDITSQESRQSMVEIMRKKSGHIDVLVNNAGVYCDAFKRYSPGDDIKTFQQRLMSSSTPEDFTRTFDTNVSAVYFTTVAFLELLHLGNERRLPGSPTSQVITMSSGAGFRRDDKVYSLSYGLSKAAVTQLGKQFANILAPFKIRSNIVVPGIYPSEMTDGIFNMDCVGPEAVPLERPGNIDDMGGLILYLVSRAGAYANGGVFLSDGGRLGLFPSSY